MKLTYEQVRYLERKALDMIYYPEENERGRVIEYEYSHSDDVACVNIVLFFRETWDFNKSWCERKYHNIKCVYTSIVENKGKFLMSDHVEIDQIDMKLFSYEKSIIRKEFYPSYDEWEDLEYYYHDGEYNEGNLKYCLEKDEIKLRFKCSDKDINTWTQEKLIGYEHKDCAFTNDELELLKQEKQRYTNFMKEKRWLK